MEELALATRPGGVYPLRVVRVFLKSAKGAARTTNPVGNRIAPDGVYPLRVLRVFLKRRNVVID